MALEAQSIDSSRAAVRSSIELNSEFDLAFVAMNFLATISVASRQGYLYSAEDSADHRQSDE
jgi:hypothetical protein